jgi:bifunctional ADP-heptose synthase (sugar kinase/adenylyltransferase)
MGRIISYGEIRSIVAQERASGKTIVFTSGGFDCFHAGHLKHLHDCASEYKNTCLFVAVAGDEMLRIKGPDRPFHNQLTRATAVANTDYADYVVINKDDKFDGRTHGRILKLLRPDIWILPKGSFFFAVKKIVAENLGIRIRMCRRKPPPGLDGISTSRIIEDWRTLLGAP